MKKVKQQVNAIVDHYLKSVKIWIVTNKDVKLLLLGNTLYSSLILNDVTFDVARIFMDKQEVQVNQKDFPALFLWILESWTEVSEADFNRYDLQWEIVSIEWSDYWIVAKQLVRLIELCKDYKYKIIIHEWYLAIVNEHDIPLVVTWMLKLQAALF